MSPKRIIAICFCLGLIGLEALQTSALIYQSRIAEAYESLQTEHVESTLLMSNDTNDLHELKTKLLQLKQDYEIESVQALVADNSSLQISFSSAEDIAIIMATVGGSITLEPDYIVSATAVPLEPHYDEQWYLNNNGQTYHASATVTTSGTPNIDINWQSSYEETSLRGQGIIIAVIDSGMNPTHPDLVNNLWTNPGETQDNIDNDGNNLLNDVHGWNFVNNTDDFTDDLGHGTQAAGIIAAVENSNGIIGIAPQAKIMPLKVLNSAGNGSTSNVIKAVNYAVAKGAKVINMSFGGPGADTQAMRNVCNSAVASGTVIVAAAGNSNYDIDSHHFAPASISSVIAVGSITNTGAKASFSNTGTALSLVTPGVQLLTTRSGSNAESSNQVLNDNTNSYIISSGTSFSSPMVAAAAALVAQQNPNFTVAQIRATLEQSARDLGTTGKDGNFGYGLLDIEAALGLSIPTPPANQAPQVISSQWSTNPVAENSTTILSITTQDNENDALTVTANMSALGLSTQTLSTTNNTIFTSTAIQPQTGAGEFTVPFTVSDATHTATGSIMLTVTTVPSTITITQPTTELTFSTTESNLTLGGTVSGLVQSITINSIPLTTFTAGQTTWSKEVALPESTNVFNVSAYNNANQVLVSDSIIITKTIVTPSPTPTPTPTTISEPTPTAEPSSSRNSRRRRRERDDDDDDPIVTAQLFVANFVDVSTDNFAYTQINDLTKKGAVSGINNFFFPNKAISRGEFLKIAMTDSGLISSDCSQIPTAFTDTKGTVFSDIINCAVGQRIVANTSTNFSPYQSISREQAILWLVAMRRVNPAQYTTTFPDVSNPLTIPYIETARQRLWISGSNGLFYPRNTLSRSEAAKIIVNSRS